MPFFVFPLPKSVLDGCLPQDAFFPAALGVMLDYWWALFNGKSHAWNWKRTKESELMLMFMMALYCIAGPRAVDFLTGLGCTGQANWGREFSPYQYNLPLPPSSTVARHMRDVVDAKQISTVSEYIFGMMEDTIKEDSIGEKSVIISVDGVSATPAIYIFVDKMRAALGEAWEKADKSIDVKATKRKLGNEATDLKGKLATELLTVIVTSLSGHEMLPACAIPIAKQGADEYAALLLSIYVQAIDSGLVPVGLGQDACSVNVSGAEKFLRLVADLNAQDEKKYNLIVILYDPKHIVKRMIFGSYDLEIYYGGSTFVHKTMLTNLRTGKFAYSGLDGHIKTVELKALIGATLAEEVKLQI